MSINKRISLPAQGEEGRPSHPEVVAITTRRGLPFQNDLRLAECRLKDGVFQGSSTSKALKNFLSQEREHPFSSPPPWPHKGTALGQQLR